MSKFNQNGKPWVFGKDVSKCLTAQDVMETAGLDWTVEKCPLVAKMPFRLNSEKNISIDDFVNDGNIYKTCPSAYATYRTDIDYPIGIVQEKYTVIQNQDAFKFFNTCIGEGKAEWDRAACLNMGETVFVSAKLPIKTDVDGDPIENYLVFSNGHAGNRSIDIMFTPIRVACTNMLNGAIKNANAHIRIRHTQSAKEKLEIGSQVLKVACKQAIDCQELYRKLNNVKLDDYAVMEYLCKLQLTDGEMELLMQYNKTRGFEDVVFRRARCLEVTGISSRKANMLYNMFDYYNFGIAQKDIYGTAWGAYNAVTGFYSNVANLEGEKRMNSLVWGNANNNMCNALNDALAYAS